jgi:hypothetical protein
MGRRPSLRNALLMAPAGLVLGLLALTVALTVALADGGQAVGDFRVFLPAIAADAPRAPTPTPKVPSSTPTSTPTAPAANGSPTPTPTASGQSAIAPVTITSLTSPIGSGETATLTAQTAPGARCTLAYTSPAGTVTSVPGIGPATANAAGVVTWSWTIVVTTRPGTGTVLVGCGGQAVSAPIVITAS